MNIEDCTTREDYRAKALELIRWSDDVPDGDAAMISFSLDALTVAVLSLQAPLAAPPVTEPVPEGLQPFEPVCGLRISSRKTNNRCILPLNHEGPHSAMRTQCWAGALMPVPRCLLSEGHAGEHRFT